MTVKNSRYGWSVGMEDAASIKARKIVLLQPALGDAVTEQLHIEVKAKVLQNVRFKYAIATAPGSTRLW